MHPTGLRATASQLLTLAPPGPVGTYAIAAAGDVDGDGYGDVIVGVSSFDDFGSLPPGKSAVFRGSSSGAVARPIVEWTGMMTADYFGGDVAGAGDVNGDRLSDVAVAETDARDAMDRAVGAAHVFLGRRSMPPAAAPSRSVFGEYSSGGYAHAIELGADTNGDGYSELLVLARRGYAPPTNIDMPLVLQYRGGSGGVSMTPLGVFGTTVGRSSIARVGDVNRDGRTDIVWTDSQKAAAGLRGAGEVVVIRTSDEGLIGDGWMWRGTVMDQQLGGAVGANDSNGDGFPDVVISSVPFAPALSQVSLFNGALGSLPASATRTWTATSAGDRFGASLAM